MIQNKIIHFQELLSHILAHYTSLRYATAMIVEPLEL